MFSGTPNKTGTGSRLSLSKPGSLHDTRVPVPVLLGALRESPSTYSGRPTSIQRVFSPNFRFPHGRDHHVRGDPAEDRAARTDSRFDSSDCVVCCLFGGFRPPRLARSMIRSPPERIVPVESRESNHAVVGLLLSGCSRSSYGPSIAGFDVKPGQPPIAIPEHCFFRAVAG